MRESSLWFWHIIAGAVIFVFLGLHMFIMHLESILGFLGLGYGGDVTSAQSVFMRSQQGFYMVTYIILLGAALYHGLYGFRNILFELTLSRPLEKIINWSFVLGGLALFVYGTYVAVFIFLNPTAV